MALFAREEFGGANRLSQTLDLHGDYDDETILLLSESGGLQETTSESISS